ncbi:Ig-like domain-containing protein [Pseudonocardia sp. KRD291]|uniref:L,D-transpeptidase n=1 Tax=Pseudonocardia sp. KRD291 TaxID=2792007 RepID=UPI001C4A1F75|nr:Ig-like domain-containing protein [Pseudonocardia sp. KRD291]MBW0105327.1 L,D-transpeptidase family protein [Pseudonocardia sp. KRD291]
MSRSWERSRGRHRPRRRVGLRTLHRRTLAKLLAVGVIVAALAAGGATAFASDSVRNAIAGNLVGADRGPGDDAGRGAGEIRQPAVAPVLTTMPPAGATGTGPRDAVGTTVTGGQLRDVALRNADGEAVQGALAPDGRTWTATEPLGYGSTYRWSGSWVRDDGTVTPLTGQFGTLDPARTARATMNIGDGATVGVGAPVIITFDRTLTDKAKADVERALSVRTSRKVEGAWAWLPDTADGSRVHYRPRTYWPAHTTVTVDAPLYGMDLGAAGYAAKDLSSTFTVGRSQIVKADAQSHQLVVVRDGKTVQTFDASYGKESDPRRVTRSGTHVVMGKSQKVLMTNRDYGYVDLPQYWAVRISNNGEFIHANPASASSQGNSNVTHGCVNLSTADARSYFGSAVFGDPVEVVGTTQELTAADGDIYDWAITWADWKSMSALARAS